MFFDYPIQTAPKLLSELVNGIVQTQYKLCSLAYDIKSKNYST